MANLIKINIEKLPAGNFIDGIPFDGKQPNEYLKKFSIGAK